MPRKRTRYENDERPSPVIWHNRPTEITISSLYPELLAIIFSYLNVRDKGRVAQVSVAWRDAAYHKSVWRNVEAKLHLRQSNTTLFASLVRRGIKRVQILSLQRSLKEVVHGIPNLERLSLIGCFNLTNEKLISAFNQPNLTLTHLNLSMCKQITDRSLQKILPFLKVLQVLDLGGCGNITNSLLITIHESKCLKYLNLRSCRNITDTGISFLAGFRSGLKASTPSSPSSSSSPSSASSSFAFFSSSSLNSDANENCDIKTNEQLSLEHLVLQDCQKITDESLKYISLGLSKLKQLNLSFCAGITEFGLKYLSNLTNLTELNLRSCVNINDKSLQYLSEVNLHHNLHQHHSYSSNHNYHHHQQQQQQKPQLQSLDISFCDKVTDNGLTFLANTFHQLNSLSLNSCQITDEGLTKLSQSLINLQILNIGQCTRITDKSLIAICENCLQLKTIDLYGCVNVTTIGLEKLMNLPNLKGLNLGLWENSNDNDDDNNNINDNNDDELMENCDQNNENNCNDENYHRHHLPHHHYQQQNHHNQMLEQREHEHIFFNQSNQQKELQNLHQHKQMQKFFHEVNSNLQVAEFYGNLNNARDAFYFGNHLQMYRDECMHTKLCDSCQNVKLLLNSQISRNSYYSLFRVCDT